MAENGGNFEYHQGGEKRVQHFLKIDHVIFAPPLSCIISACPERGLEPVVTRQCAWPLCQKKILWDKYISEYFFISMHHQLYIQFLYFLVTHSIHKSASKINKIFKSFEVKTHFHHNPLLLFVVCRLLSARVRFTQWPIVSPAAIN